LTLSLPATCDGTGISPTDSGYAVVTSPPVPGGVSCPAIQGQPTGTAAGANPVSVCCM
jgi:hypothetical protein